MRLPKVVQQLTTMFDAWIVGGGANPDIETGPRDWDVAVPFQEWRKAACLIPASASKNTFGGWKFEEDGQVIDVWPADIHWLLTQDKTVYGWHPASGTRIKKV